VQGGAAARGAGGRPWLRSARGAGTAASGRHR
jgi:hypothetical protein